MKRLFYLTVSLVLCTVVFMFCDNKTPTPLEISLETQDEPISLTKSTGAVTDPVGDAWDDPLVDPDPDLVSAYVYCDGENLNLRVQFDPSSFNSQTARASFVIDIDENPATGFPGVDASGNDADIMSGDYQIKIGATLGANATVTKYFPVKNMGTFPITILNDGYDVSIPLSVFDYDQDGLNYKVIVQSHLFDNAFTGIVDYMPDLGLQPGHTAPCLINVEVDIKPQSCPNSLNINSKGVLPGAILGTASFDVSDIDVSTIALEGVSPERCSIEDVATPVVDRQHECECTTDGADGFADLSLKFDTQAIVAALGDVYDGEQRILTLTGNLKDGTPIDGKDCVVIISN